MSNILDLVALFGFAKRQYKRIQTSITTLTWKNTFNLLHYIRDMRSSLYNNKLLNVSESVDDFEVSMNFFLKTLKFIFIIITFSTVSVEYYCRASLKLLLQKYIFLSLKNHSITHSIFSTDNFFPFFLFLSAQLRVTLKAAVRERDSSKNKNLMNNCSTTNAEVY